MPAALAGCVREKVGSASEDVVPELDAFLSGLRIAWKSGEVRSVATNEPRPPRGRRRRPDPLVEVTAQLKSWLEDEPWRTGRELLEKLQADQPGDYPGTLLRTVQRRLKVWRSEHALALVFNGSAALPDATVANAMPGSVEV